MRIEFIVDWINRQIDVYRLQMEEMIVINELIEEWADGWIMGKQSLIKDKQIDILTKH